MPAVRHDSCVPADIGGLTLRWTRAWGPRPPLSYELRGRFPDRWVRFHSLPGSKRYAGSQEEHDEILHRHMTTLSQLTGHASHPGTSLLAITASWSQTATATDRSGQLCRAMPAAAYWTSVLTDDSPGDDQVWAHLWVSATSLSDPDLKELLRLAADDISGPVVITSADIRWLYAPYDGGADVITDTSQHRDQLRHQHRDWLSAHPSGL